jgi:hypothetical protein
MVQSSLQQGDLPGGGVALVRAVPQQPFAQRRLRRLLLLRLLLAAPRRRRIDPARQNLTALSYMQDI